MDRPVAMKSNLHSVLFETTHRQVLGRQRLARTASPPPSSRITPSISGIAQAPGRSVGAGVEGAPRGPAQSCPDRSARDHTMIHGMWCL